MTKLDYYLAIQRAHAEGFTGFAEALTDLYHLTYS
jgi:hypothetical protein